MTITEPDSTVRDAEAKSCLSIPSPIDFNAQQPELFAKYVAKLRAMCGDDLPNALSYFASMDQFPFWGIEPTGAPIRRGWVSFKSLAETAGTTLATFLRRDLEALGLRYGHMAEGFKGINPSTGMQGPVSIEQREQVGTARQCEHDILIVMVAASLAKSVTPEQRAESTARLNRAKSKVEELEADIYSNREGGKQILAARVELWKETWSHSRFAVREKYLRAWRKHDDHRIFFGDTDNATR